MSMLKSKIAGAVYGFAIGDAMGATTEFMSSKEIAKSGKVTNIVGGGWLNLKAGEVTDDTQMSLCVMKALMQSADDMFLFEQRVIRHFIEWADSKPKDIGNQCARGINCLKAGIRISYEAESLGNGSLMRAMPCAVVNAFVPRSVWNIIQGRLIHNNLTCDLLIQEYSEMMSNLIHGLEFEFDGNNRRIPTGCIINTFDNAKWFLAHSKSFEEGIIEAVNDGGDADTIAAITGSLLGAKYGFDSIPDRWLEQLDPKVCQKLDEFIYYVFENLI